MIPNNVQKRLAAGIKKFQTVLESAKSRDINESDTVVIVADILSEVFGYDKYHEITSEYTIRGTFCDIALKIDTKPHYLIEVKAIGSDLKESHLKQATDYAANEGVDWVILTNGVIWRVMRLQFNKPITSEQVIELDMLSMNPRRPEDLQGLFLLSREAIKKSALLNYHAQAQATSRFLLGALSLTDPVIEVIRREVRRVSPGIAVDIDEVRNVLREEVLKREVAYGEHYDEACKKIRKAQGRFLRKSIRKLEVVEQSSVQPQESGKNKRAASDN